MSAMQSLMRSLSPEQRAELDSMMDALLRDDRLRWDLAQLASTLDQLLPGGLGDRMRFRGQESLGLDGALAQLARIGRMDRLSRAALRHGGSGRSSMTLDDDELRELLGDEAAEDVAALRDAARRLEEAGYIERDGERLELTPRGARRLGPAGAGPAVRTPVAGCLRRPRAAAHRARPGSAPRHPAPWEFGRPFELDLAAAHCAGALGRAENAPALGAARVAAGGRRILLSPADFVVHDSEDRSRCGHGAAPGHEPLDAAAGLRPGGQEGGAGTPGAHPQPVPAGHAAHRRLRLLARGRSPAESLATVSWDAYEYGTNLQHGLMVARRLLARSHSANRSVLVITDGEPTAHIEDGRVEFAYPPTRRTISETLKEVVRCTREGIVINTFMLEQSPGAGGIRGARHQAQPRACLPRRPRRSWASTCWSTTSAGGRGRR